MFYTNTCSPASVLRNAAGKRNAVFDHVTIRATDRAASERFYDTVLDVLGLNATRGRSFTEWDAFSVAQADAEHPPTERLHVGFYAPSRELVDEFWRVGTDAGYRDDGPPGPRPQYSADYYGSFLLDPDGSSVEAVTHERPRVGAIDHLWIRVTDVDAATAFYATIAPHAGYGGGRRLADPDRTIFENLDGDGSFSVVHDGPPTRNVHLAFPAGDNGTVDAFHAAALAAGYRDNGGPGERREYHAGYYGAFVLDADANNVEVVCHNR
jgi:catechol 2,3-dioxygenase-like lactoylglutathione lyase family enzyme